MSLPTTATLVPFGAATLAIVALPGPAVLYIVTRSLQHGRAAGLCSVLGIVTGAVVHVVAATAGLAAVLEHARCLGRLALDRGGLPAVAGRAGAAR